MAGGAVLLPSVSSCAHRAGWEARVDIAQEKAGELIMLCGLGGVSISVCSGNKRLNRTLVGTRSFHKFWLKSVTKCPLPQTALPDSSRQSRPSLLDSEAHTSLNSHIPLGKAGSSHTTPRRG